VSIVITIAAVAIIGGVIVVARGLGGELARDRVPVGTDLDVATGADVARYRPPPALLGYQPEATERAFTIVGRSIAERDEEIAWLRGRLAELQPETSLRPGFAVAKGRPAGAATASDAEPDPGDSDSDDPDTGAAVGGAAGQER
jgi:hypothetical protein